MWGGVRSSSKLSSSPSVFELDLRMEVSWLSIIERSEDIEGFYGGDRKGAYSATPRSFLQHLFSSIRPGSRPG